MENECLEIKTDISFWHTTAKIEITDFKSFLSGENTSVIYFWPPL